MDNQNLQPHILCKEGDIAPFVLLPGDPGRVLRIAELLDEFKEISFNREYRVVTGKYKNISVTICSTGIGGPATAIAMEELINLGAKVFIRIGSCGASQENIQIGDMIISDSVIREDDTTIEYVPVQFPAVADRKIVNLLEASAQLAGVRYFIGSTVSIDALYSPQTKEKKDFWKKFGALAQDMETGTVLTLARIKGIKAGAILLVVDQEGEKNLKEKITQYSVEAKENKGELVDFEKQAIKIALEAILKYGKTN